MEENNTFRKKNLKKSRRYSQLTQICLPSQSLLLFSKCTWASFYYALSDKQVSDHDEYFKYKKMFQSLLEIF